MTNNNQHPTLTGAEILWASLAGEGTITVFGSPAHAILTCTAHPITITA